MKTLLELLGKELHDQVVEKLGDTQVFLHTKDQKVIINDGVNFIPKHRFDELNETNKNLLAQVTKAESDLSELKKVSGDNKELHDKIKALEAENKKAKTDFEKSELSLKKSLAVKEALLNAGAIDPEARELLLAKFKLDELEIDQDGKIKDFDNKLKPIKEHKTLSSLFGENKFEGADHKEGSLTPGANGLYTMEQISRMSQEEVNANLDLVNKSMAATSVVTK